MLKVDSESLRALASGLAEQSDAIRRLDPAALVRPGVDAMPSSSFALVAAGSADPVRAAYHAMAERIQNMADAATVSAYSYEQAESAFRAQLAQYLNGH
jgi:hypothetical protein